jgi:aromatase
MSVPTSVVEKYRTVHSVDVAAPAERVFGIIADVTDWPLHFAPNVHTEQVESDAGVERIRIWATANDEIKTWSSVRVLNPADGRVSFRQDVSTPPVEAMDGEWIVTPVDAANSRLDLVHTFRAIDDDPAGIEWIHAALERNSASELDGIKRLAELGDQLDELVFGFSDTVHVEGDGADVFDFLNRADLWPERLPHVARLDLVEDLPGVQVMTMDTSTKDGSVHTTRSVRVCFAPNRIVYKQTEVPALMTAHTGSWTIVRSGTGVDVTSRHDVTVRPDAVERILGAGSTVADARSYIQRALSTNSTTTLRHARDYAEGRRG